MVSINMLIVACLASLLGACLEPSPSSELAQIANQKKAIQSSQIDAERSRLRNLYQKEVQTDPIRVNEVELSQVSCDGATMRYSVSKIGEKPKTGYPIYIALHGGGSAPASLNDSQWEGMKVYYKDSVPVGLYIATRGVTNDWNLHFRDESYPLYDRLIENMVVFEGADPNRVYLVGYSAGGDGVYQIAARMPDRWAAANMSAGHHNGVSPVNMRNLPFQMQVGELDSAYNRNKETVRFSMQLDKLAAADPKGYEHNINVHIRRPHNFLDNHPGRISQKVYADPVKWLETGQSEIVERDTNAVSWLAKHVRNPLPDKVVWDPTVNAPKRGGAKLPDGKPLFASSGRLSSLYWLILTGADAAPEGGAPVIVRAARAENGFVVEKCGKQLRLLVTRRMFDLSRPISISIDGQKLSIKVRPMLNTMAQTLIDRGDPEYMFEATIAVSKGASGWTAKQE